MSSLENLCLNVIIQKFEFLYLAFSVTNDEIMKRNFDILNRKYSFEIMSELFKKKQLKKEFLDFFLNEHLKILHCKWFEKNSWEYSIEDVLFRLPNLTTILCNKCNDETLENIAKFCPKIIEIDAGSSCVTNKGIKYLCRNENGTVPCPTLKNIFIHSYMVTDDCWKNLLQSLPYLEACFFKIPDILYSLHKRDLPNLENIRSYNFVRLELLGSARHFPNYTDILKLCLSVCPRLKWIECDITEKEQLNWFKSTNMEYLYLDFLQKGQKLNIDNLLKKCGSNLKCLTTENCIFSISKLAGNCPKLENLIIRHGTFPDDPHDSKPIFHHLECFSFYYIIDNNSSTSEALRLLLLCSPILQRIYFYDCILSPDTKTYILKCCESHNLKFIWLYCSEVEMNFLKDVLSSCSSSTILDLREWDGDHVELINFARMLPHKPRVVFDGDGPIY